MNYVDTTLIRLADPTSRSGVFDSIALEQLVTASYDADLMGVERPYQPLFDDFRLGFPTPQLGMVEGTWNPVGGVEKVEARFHVSGVGNGSMVRVDAFWRGSIVARTKPATGRVTEVETAWPDPATIDAEIEAAFGALPADPQALEQERRARFLAHIRAALDQPAAFTDTMFDEWLQSVGATSVGNLLTRFQGTVHLGAVQVTFSPPAPAPPSPKPLPIGAALLIRDAGFSVAQLLMESKLVRQQLAPLRIAQPRDPSLRLREPLLVIWVIPPAVFDDPDWPGGAAGMTADQLREARRVAAGKWLAREGIGLVATS